MKKKNYEKFLIFQTKCKKANWNVTKIFNEFDKLKYWYIFLMNFICDMYNTIQSNHLIIAKIWHNHGCQNFKFFFWWMFLKVANIKTFCNYPISMISDPVILIQFCLKFHIIIISWPFLDLKPFFIETNNGRRHFFWHFNVKSLDKDAFHTVRSQKTVVSFNPLFMPHNFLSIYWFKVFKCDALKLFD